MSEISTEPVTQIDAESEPTLVDGYLNETQHRSPEEMLDQLKDCSTNRLWTQEEKECLVYFANLVKQDFDALHGQYFHHRTVGALKTRYGKIIRGEDTPATTPRLSLGNYVAHAANTVMNSMTPRKAATPARAADDAMETIEEEGQELETIEEEAEKNEIEGTFEQGEGEKHEEEEAEVQEEPKAKDEGFNFFIPAAGVVVLMYVAIILCMVLGEDTLKENLPEEASQLIIHYRTALQQQWTMWISKLPSWSN